jgi:competence protein ComEC
METVEQTTKNRPALAAAFVVILGILCAKLAALHWLLFAIPAMLFFCAAGIELLHYHKVQGRNVVPSSVFLLSLFFASGASFVTQNNQQNVHHITRFLKMSDSLIISCKIIDQPKVKDGRTTALVEVLSLRGEQDSIRVEGRANLTIFPHKRLKEMPLQIPYGSILTFKGMLEEPSAERNPGEFSYKEYLALNNIYALITVAGYSNIAIAGTREPNWFFEDLIFPSKNFITRTITSVMKGDEANFLIGLLLGDRTDISEEIKKAFTNTGTIHVLAVSGSHVILVVTIIYIIFGLLRVPNKPKILLTICALVYYTFLTGAAPSIVRASMMAGIVLLGKYVEQKTDSYNVLGLSAVIMFLYDPKQLFDVGFQLSFAAVFSMVYFYPKLNSLIKRIPEPLEEFKIITPVWQLFALSLAAQIGTLPFTAYYFGKVSLISLFANLLVVPLVGIIVTIGLTGALLGAASSWISIIFSEANNLIAWFTLTLVKLAEQVPYAVINTAAFGWKETVLYSAVIAWLFNLNNRTLQKNIIFFLLAFGNIVIYSLLFADKHDKVTVTFLDVGQGDAAVIQTPNGETILVDAGPITQTYNAGEKIVVPFLRRKGIATIDAAITSHPHADHLGGMPYVIKHLKVKSTIDANQRLHSQLYDEYDALEKDIPQITARAGMIQSFGAVRLYYLHPTRRFIDEDSSDGYSNINESSVVFKLQYGKTSFLFMGDAETEAEHHLRQVYHDFLDCDVLKAGHHGSSTSSTEDFVESAKPEHVVISVARFNKFKHPSRAVIKRYLEHGAIVHRTDNEGAIIFESNGSAVRQVEWRNNR